MDNSPEASRLVLLSQLAEVAAGTKVRFLGCVDGYDSTSAILQLKDRFPTVTAKGSTQVHVANVLDALNVELTQVGAWVNVIGYVRQKEERHSSSSLSPNGSESRVSTVDAVIIWSAGAVKLNEYEAAVRALQTSAI